MVRKKFSKKAIARRFITLFLIAILFTVFFTAIGEIYGKESDVSGDFPVVRSIDSNATEKSEDEVSSYIEPAESMEPQEAFCMSDELADVNDAPQGSTDVHLYVEPDGKITVLPSSPQVSTSTNDTSQNTVSTTDTSNNVVESIEIWGYESGSGDDPVTPGPDLLFIDIYTTPTPPVGDSLATITFQLKNQGTTAATNFRSYGYIGGIGTWYWDIGSLGAGSIANLNLGVTLPPGTYELAAKADVRDDVAEDNELNNEYSETTMWEGPDLVFTDIWTNPDPPIGEQQVTIYFQIKNQGTQDAVGDFSSNFFIDGAYWGSGINHGLPAGAAYNWWGTATLAPGWHHLAAEADCHGQIVESDETNNERYERIWFNGPDLIAEDVWIAGSYITAGQPFGLDWTIKNIGDNDSGWFQHRVYIDGVFRWFYNDAGLSPGQVRWVRGGGEWLSSGWHTIEIVADYFNNVTETCEGNNNRTESFYSHKAQWTVLVYLDGDNNLEGWMIDNFLQMAKVGSYRHLSIVVQMDRNTGYDTRYDDWTDCKRFFVKAGATPTASNALQNLGEVNMGDDSALISFATWGINRFEAEHYMLNPVDHGGSWVGCCWDDTSGDHLTLIELRDTLSSIKETLGRNLDVIWWNDCLMNSIEVATQVYPYADYMAGSETVSWTGTWDYTPIVTALRHWPAPTPQELAIDITQFGTPRDSSGSRTQSISSIDLSQVDTLMGYVNSFSKALKNNLYQYRTQIGNARSASSWYEGPYAGWTQRLIDLYQFAHYIKLYVPDSTIDSMADNIMNSIGPPGGAIGKVVMEEDHSASASFCHGLGIYFPLTISVYDSSYTDWNDFTDATQWDEFLQCYYHAYEPCLVVRGGDNGIYYNVHEEGGTWTGWVNVPGATNDPPAAAILANKLHIVVLGTDGNMYHGYVDLDSDAWSGWTHVPGGTPSPPTLTAYGDRLYLVVRGNDNQIYVKIWEGYWYSWWHTDITGTTCDSPAAIGKDNQLHIVVRGTTGGLYHSYIDIPTWTQSSWISIPGDTPSRPALTTDDSHLYLVLRGGDDNIYYNEYAPFLIWWTWLGWTQIPGSTQIGPGASCFEGKLNIVVRGIPSGLFAGAVDLSTSSWLGWTTLSGDTPSQPALTRP